MRRLILILLPLIYGCGSTRPNRWSDTSATPGYAQGYLEGHYDRRVQARFVKSYYGDTNE